MKTLVVHPVMGLMGGGERLCCETIRALISNGQEVTLLSEAFDRTKIENFFGYPGLFDKVSLCLYPSKRRIGTVGTISHMIHQLPAQNRALKKLGNSHSPSFDLIFSTQEVGYIPDVNVPVIQWGYFPSSFPRLSGSRSSIDLARAMRWLPLRMYIEHKLSRIGLVLAISQYSKGYLDKEWKRPSALVYPPCNMVETGAKRNLVVTTARAVPIKRLELFWEVARLRPNYEFAMLLTQDPNHIEYSTYLSEAAPHNGRTIFNPSKETYHKVLSEAKVYLHLMEREHFGISVVEAMSASCVPVVHDSGGPKEIVDGEAGFRWQTKEEIPRLVDEAMKRAPSASARRRAEEFAVGKFEKRLSSIFSQLHA
jgi:glycosyltransferase involved in cell wall biosynthesis